MRDTKQLPIATLLLCIGFSVLVLSAWAHHSYTPKQGFVPEEKTAIRIAEAVLMPIYGEEQILGERPFSADLKAGIWAVEGHLSPNMDGGVARVELAKRDARILRVTHGK